MFSYRSWVAWLWLVPPTMIASSSSKNFSPHDGFQCHLMKVSFPALLISCAIHFSVRPNQLPLKNYKSRKCVKLVTKCITTPPGVPVIHWSHIPDWSQLLFPKQVPTLRSKHIAFNGNKLMPPTSMYRAEYRALLYTTLRGKISLFDLPT